jgi:hypothetical protein
LASSFASSQVISPLTTLVQNKIEANGKTLEQATSDVKISLGGKDPLVSYDPTDPSDEVAKLADAIKAVLDIVRQTLATLGANANNDAVTAYAINLILDQLSTIANAVDSNTPVTNIADDVNATATTGKDATAVEGFADDYEADKSDLVQEQGALTPYEILIGSGEKYFSTRFRTHELKDEDQQWLDQSGCKLSNDKPFGAYILRAYNEAGVSSAVARIDRLCSSNKIDELAKIGDGFEFDDLKAIHDAIPARPAGNDYGFEGSFGVLADGKLKGIGELAEYTITSVEITDLSGGPDANRDWRNFFQIEQKRYNKQYSQWKAEFDSFVQGIEFPEGSKGYRLVIEGPEDEPDEHNDDQYWLNAKATKAILDALSAKEHNLTAPYQR